MNEILLAIKLASQLIEGVTEAMEFIKSGEEIPPSTLRKLQADGNTLDSDLDDLIARREQDEEQS